MSRPHVADLRHPRMVMAADDVVANQSQHPQPRTLAVLPIPARPLFQRPAGLAPSGWFALLFVLSHASPNARLTVSQKLRAHTVLRVSHLIKNSAEML